MNNGEGQAELWPESDSEKKVALAESHSDAPPDVDSPKPIHKIVSSEVRVRPVGSFGEKLQREREMRNVTLEEISLSTKISTRNLRALETEKFDQLPGGIFNRGFVRSYARYLGLNEEQAVADYLSAAAEQESKNPAVMGFAQNVVARPHEKEKNEKVINIRAAIGEREIPIEPDSEAVESDPAGKVLMAAVILVVLLGIGGLVWKWKASRSASPAVGSSAAQTSVPSAQTTSVTHPLATTPSQQTSPANPATERTGANTPAAATAPAAQNNASTRASNPTAANQATENSSTTSPASSATSSTAARASLSPNAGTSASSATTSPDAATAKPESKTTSKPSNKAANAAPIHVELHAREESWIQVQSNGRTLMEGVLSADARRSFRASDELVVRLGNAPGVDITFNGQPYAVPADGARNRSFTFTPQGAKR